MTKTCHQCKLEFERTSKFFNVDCHQADGLRATCRKCRRKRYQKEDKLKPVVIESVEPLFK
jgi:hypothetical protein